MKTREIKFRGKDVLNNRWVYGQFLNLYSSRSAYQSIQPHIQHWSDGSVNTPEVKPETVGQFIGLAVSSEEVYVGDIISLWKNGKEYFRGVVTDHGHAGYTIDSKNDYMGFELKGYEYRWIGNIHDNPALV